MNKRFTIISILSFFAISSIAQKTIFVKVTNNSNLIKENQPIVVSLKKTSVNVKSALVECNDKETPCQLDDTDRDGIFDELCFLTNLDRQQSKTFKVTLSDTGTPLQYKQQVYAEMLIRSSKIKVKNRQNLYISELTVNNGVNPYSEVHHHGAAFENELLAMRIYFDNRQTVDLYGKFHKGLELKETQFYPDAEQKTKGYGDDILWVGNSYGLGALRGWNGTKQTMLDNVDRRSQRIISYGPLRTIIEVEDKGWIPQPGQQPIDMKIHYILYAGRRDCTVDITFDRPVGDYHFATGLVNVSGSREYSDHKGLRGIWGTAWPVSPKDTLGHKQETLGMGILIPRLYMEREILATPDDYSTVLHTNGKNIRYYITYSSDNEDYGFHSEREWFKWLSEWEKDYLNPVSVSVVLKSR